MPARPPMVSWDEFQRLRPDLAEAGRRLLYQFGVGLAFLATARREAAMAQFLAERRLEAPPPGFETDELFEFHLERCLWTQTSGHGDWAPRHTVWRAT